jgi:hypothetical protein
VGCARRGVSTLARVPFAACPLVVRVRGTRGSTCLGADSSDVGSRVASDDGIWLDVALDDGTRGDNSMLADCAFR